MKGAGDDNRHGLKMHATAMLYTDPQRRTSYGTHTSAITAPAAHFMATVQRLYGARTI